MTHLRLASIAMTLVFAGAFVPRLRSAASSSRLLFLAGSKSGTGGASTSSSASAARLQRSLSLTTRRSAFPSLSVTPRGGGGGEGDASPSSSRSQSALFQSTAEATVTEGDASTTTSTETTSVLLADDSAFTKSDPDKRQYRAVQLQPSGLTVLLVSDPETDVEAAAVHVRAGHFDDPANRAGLAHFHEHMLFLGTEKYPDEDAYESFLGSNGGMSNAYTDMEDTNYYFNVAPLGNGDDDSDEESDGTSGSGGTSAALSGALDRFAQFFVAPCFDPSMLDRELRAVNSEYLNGKTADNWRNYQMLKFGANPDHPFSKFGCGNYNTLTDGGDVDAGKDEGEEESSDSGVDKNLLFGGGSSPRDELVRFWNEKYHAGNLRLCVAGRSSLDELQSTVERTFGAVRPAPAGFVANGIVDRTRAGLLAANKDGSVVDPIFVTSHATYGGIPAFGAEQLGKIREVVPLVESRSLKIMSAGPPMSDPLLKKSRPFRVLSHLVGHESPGSLHHLLHENGWINGLSSGVGLDTSDFSMTSIGIALTPKGMRERDQVLARVWEWLALIRSSVENDDVISGYHDELRRITDISFRYREMSDVTDFCSSAAGSLFDYEAEKVLVGGAETEDYDADVARAFLGRMTPENSLIVVTGPELGEDTGPESSAKETEWQTEKWYGGKFRDVRISDSLVEQWENPSDIDSRLRLPPLNEFIPKDLSLKCDDAESLAAVDPDVDYRKEPPKLLIDEPKLQMWHKMDRTFRVPKTSIRLQLTSPSVYKSPRAITLNRLFQKVLSDDLNSYVYDASLAGCNYAVSCIPSAYRLSLSGYSEKLPHLLDVVTSRIASLIEEMKEGEEAQPALGEIFSKAKENLLRQTKNFIFDSPYETGTYNARMLMETPVWHVEDYTAEMEGPDAELEPLTMEECARAAEDCLFGRTKATSLCIGNIDEKGAREVADVIQNSFLKSRALSEDENPRFRSVKMPTKEEASRIFGSSDDGVTGSKDAPIVYEALAHSESEENNSVEILMQTSSMTDLGYEGLAIQELIGHMAYNSAFAQLRTKEQLGYIVSSYTKKITGGGNAFCVIVQSSSTSPPDIEERCMRWVEQFRQELEEMSPERIAMEASAVKANLLEKDIKLSEEIGSVWGEILSTGPHSDHFKTPVFDRLERFAEVLTIDSGTTEISSDSSIRTAGDLKKSVTEFYDKYFMPTSPERRLVSSRVYNQKGKDTFEANKGKPGYLSSYSDARKLKQFLSTFPTAPYWGAKGL